MVPSPARRTAPLAVAGALAALLSVIVSPAPSHAAAGCLQETDQPLALSCDDISPPVFTAGDVAVSVAGSTATVSSHATYSDADPDPITYTCALDSAGFGSCGPFSALPAGNHTLKVRATDSHDQPIAACVVVCPPAYVESTPDYTEVQKQFAMSTGGGGSPPPPGPDGDPETQITGAPTDPITPDSPVFLARHPSVVLSASEPATFNCAVNAKKVPCHDGTNVLRKLKPGPQVFVAQAVDAAGNFDATPASLAFYLPDNLRAGRGTSWSTVRSHGWYAGDYLLTRTKGATLTLGSVRDVHEVRLIAPVGPRLGKVAIRIGSSRWLKVDLHAAKNDKLHALELRGAGAKPLRGVVQLKAFKIPPGGAVAVDALVTR